MLAKIAQNLQEHKNAIRIKKLIFCACQRKWVNNVEILSQYSLRALLRELVTTYNTPEQLSHILYSIVETLNRKAVYYPLADELIEQLVPLYTQKATQASGTSQAKLSIPLNFEQILHELTAQEDLLRIKKLIYCACEDEWVNNITHLEQLTLNELVVKLLQLNPTQAQLSHTLYQVVTSLNRQGEYFLIANLILDQLLKLYAVPEAMTQVVASAPLAAQQHRKASSNATVHTKEPPVSVASPPQEVAYNPLQLRLEIIKYTNPLRAKIVLFSILKHKFDFSDRDWSLLKTYTLDSLLLQLYHRCCDLSELEKSLTSTAQTLPQPYESTQAAGAILQSLKPLYAEA